MTSNNQNKSSLRIVGRRTMQILLGTVRGRSHTVLTLDRHKTKERKVIMAGLEKLGVLVENKSILRYVES